MRWNRKKKKESVWIFIYLILISAVVLKTMNILMQITLNVSTTETEFISQSHNITHQQHNNIIIYSINGIDLHSSLKHMLIEARSSHMNFSIPLSDDSIFHFENTNEFQIKFYFTGIFNVSLLLKKKIIYEHQIVIESIDSTQFSTFACHGKNFMTRWCESKNVCIDKDGLKIFTPYKIRLDKIFIIPGARTPPFDPDHDRFKKGKIQYNYREVKADDGIWVKENTFVVGRFFNHMMLWHLIMDFITPIYWTLTSVHAKMFSDDWSVEKDPGYGTEFDQNNRIHVYDEFPKFQMEFISALTNHSIVFLRKTDDCYCYKSVVLGLRKSEKNPVYTRRKRDGLRVPYQIDPYGVKGLRQRMLNFSNVEEDCIPNIQNPKVIIIQRKGSKIIRSILNVDDVYNLTKEMCPFCNITVMDFNSMSKRKQIAFMCDVSLLIGIHGSGLTHGMWMHPSTNDYPTALVEMFPYKYECRNWYQQLATIARIQYIPIYTTSINNSRWDPWHNLTKVQRCHTQEGECERGRCHDFLRDQSIIVNLTNYADLLMPYIKQLIKSREKYNK